MKCDKCNLELGTPRELAEHLVLEHKYDTIDFLEKLLKSRSARYLFKLKWGN